MINPDRNTEQKPTPLGPPIRRNPDQQPAKAPAPSPAPAGSHSTKQGTRLEDDGADEYDSWSLMPMVQTPEAIERAATMERIIKEQMRLENEMSGITDAMRGNSAKTGETVTGMRLLMQQAVNKINFVMEDTYAPEQRIGG